MKRLICSLAVSALLFAGRASADAYVEVCYNYSCSATAEVAYSEDQLERVRQWMTYASDDRTERRILSAVLSRLYRWAGEKTPITVDKGGDVADEGVNGRMDCIDHATTTTRLLKMIDDRGWLRFHRVIEPVRRTSALGILQHFSAAIEIRPGRAASWTLSTQLSTQPGSTGVASDASEDNAPGDNRFVVDTWFHDHGEPAEVMPLKEWMEGGGPDV